MLGFFPAGCAPGLETPVTVTATDWCGLRADATRSVWVEDTVPPVFTAVPGDLTAECVSQGGTPADSPEIEAWLAEFDAQDVCGSVSEGDDMPGFLPAGCAPGLETPVTVTASDWCDLEADVTRSVWVEDTAPPVFAAIPDDLTVECASQGGTTAGSPEIEAWRAGFVAEDICGSVSDADDMPGFLPAGCAPGLETPVTVTASDWCDLEADATRSVWVEDTVPPVFTAIPDDLTVECVSQGGTPADSPEIEAWRAGFEAEDVCGGVRDTDDMPGFFPAGCAPGLETPVTVTATDDCGLQASEGRGVLVQDTRPPAFVQVPDPLTVECSARGGTPSADPAVQAWLAEFEAQDVCGSVSEADDMPALLPAGCAPGLETPVTVTATDDCGLEAREAESVWVQDTRPPAFVSVPDDVTVECSMKGGTPASHPEVEAWRSGFEAEDVCGDVTDSDDMPALFPAGCAPGLETPVRVTAADECDLEAVAGGSVWVEDTTPPFFVQVPDDLTVECSAPGGTPADDPAVVAWRASFVADDLCGGVTDRDDMPPFFPAGCAPGLETPVTVTAVDECRMESDAERSVWVQDTLPPIIEAVDFDGSCLWPPNHKYVCLDNIASRVRSRDICDPNPGARVAACSSNQPDDARDEDFPDANGDGHTVNDCVVAPDGQSLCLRSERLGTDPGGRTYSPEVQAYDLCDNTASTSASVHVPHDQSPARKECLSPEAPGTK